MHQRKILLNKFQYNLEVFTNSKSRWIW